MPTSGTGSWGSQVLCFQQDRQRGAALDLGGPHLPLPGPHHSRTECPSPVSSLPGKRSTPRAQVPCCSQLDMESIFRSPVSPKLRSGIWGLLEASQTQFLTSSRPVTPSPPRTQARDPRSLPTRHAGTCLSEQSSVKFRSAPRHLSFLFPMTQTYLLLLPSKTVSLGHHYQAVFQTCSSEQAD